MRIRTSVVGLVAVVVSAYGAAAAFGRPDDGNGSRPKVTIRVVNGEVAGIRSLMRAKKEAVRIFAHSGIDLIWLDCEAGRMEWGSTNPCQRDREGAEFWLRIVTTRPAATTKDVLGFTELDDTQNSGSGGVYYPKALEMAKKWRIGVAEVLGAAIAHEVGHLLLGADAHSAYGVMQAAWSRRQFELIGLSELNFSGDQEKMLRVRI